MGCGGSSTKTIIIQTRTVTVSGSNSASSATPSSATAPSDATATSDHVYFFGRPALQLLPEQRPGEIIFSVDGNNWMTGIRDWLGWGSDIASATGIDHVKDCVPNCAQSIAHAEPAELTLYRIGRNMGRRMYLCFRIAFARTSRTHGFGFCNLADPPEPPRSTKCGPNTTYCPVELDCPVSAAGGPASRGCYGVVGVSGNVSRPTPGPDTTGLKLDCLWSSPRLTADRTAYAYICDPGP